MPSIPDFWMFLLMIVLAIILAIANKTMWEKDKFGTIWMSIMGAGLGLLILMIPYVLLYDHSHGKYTSFFKSSETIKKEENEKLKDIKAETISCAFPENSLAWKHIYDYNNYVQREAITKLSKCKKNDKVYHKLLEIVDDNYQKVDVRTAALCVVQSYYYSYDEYDLQRLLWGNEWELNSCLTDKTISDSEYQVQESIIYVYERSNGEKATSLMHRVLKYNENARSDYVNYLMNHSNNLNRIFEDGLIDWFTNNDLLKKIEALSDRELIQGDPNVRKALLEVLKIPDKSIIYKAGNALSDAYRWDYEAQEILAMHLKSNKTSGTALDIMHDFRPAIDNDIVMSNVVKMLNDGSAYNREMAIDILKPFVVLYYSQAKKEPYISGTILLEPIFKPNISEIILKAFHRIKDISVSDLDDNIKTKAYGALPKISYNTWVNPTPTICKKNGGKIQNNTICIVEGWGQNNDAQRICEASNARLPRIEELVNEVVNCKGKVYSQTDNTNNESYQSCYENNGFANSMEYISSTSSLYKDIRNGKLKDDIWSLYFKDARVYYGNKNTKSKYIVRCVN